MEIDREALYRIKETLKGNPRGMNLLEIANAIGMNRQSVAKYMEMMVVSGHVDVKNFGTSKVYYLSQRLPMSAILSLSSDFVIILDKDLKIVNVNDKFLEFNHIKREDILYKNIEYFSFPIEFDPPIMSNVKDALNGAESAIDAYYSKGEEEYFFIVKFIPLVFDDGQKGVTVIFVNTTEQKRTEVAIKESENKLRSFIDQSISGIILTDEQGKIIEYNKGEEEVIGLSREEALGKNIWEIHRHLMGKEERPQKYYDQIQSMTVKFLETGKAPFANKYVERTITDIDNKSKIVQSVIFPIQTKKGYMLCSISRDITDRKLIEIAIAESEHKLRSVIEQSMDGIIITNERGVIIEYNRGFEQIAGIGRDGAIGKEVWDFILSILPKDKNFQEIYGRIKTAYENFPVAENTLPSHKNIETQILRRDGIIRTIQLSISPIKTEKGYMLCSIIHDTTERKQIEDMLRESEEKFRVLVETSSAAIMIYIADKFIEANRATEALTGYSREELLNMDFWNFIHPDNLEIVKERGLDRLQGKNVLSNYEVKLLTKNGETRWVEVNVCTINYKGIFSCMVTMFNITERKKAEEALKESEANLAKAKRIARLGSFCWDIASDRIYWSGEDCRILGYEIDELQPTYEAYLSIVHPDDKGLFGKSFKDALSGARPLNVDYRVMRRDGSGHFIHTEGEVSYDSFGKPVRMVGVSQDITERKQAEEDSKKMIGRLKQFNEQLSALTDVAESAMVTQDVDVLLNLILSRVMRVMNADASVILLLEKDELYARASIGVEEVVRNKFHLHVGHGFSGKIAGIGEPSYIEDIQVDTTVVNSILKNIGIRSILGVPIKHRGNIIGVLHVEWMHYHPFNRQEQDVLQIIADRCGAAILNARAD